MPRAVADTHTVIWYVMADRRLSPRAKAAIDDAGNALFRRAIASARIWQARPPGCLIPSCLRLDPLSVHWRRGRVLDRTLGLVRRTVVRYEESLVWILLLSRRHEQEVLLCPPRLELRYRTPR